MYASIRRYRLRGGTVDEVMHRIDQEFAEMLSKSPGFVAYHALEAGDELVTVSVFRDAEGASKSNEMAKNWVKESLGDMDLQRTEMLEGSVLVSRAASEVLEPAHH
jgi:hypothetical protein